jgi:hypothetical protein
MRGHRMRTVDEEFEDLIMAPCEAVLFVGEARARAACRLRLRSRSPTRGTQGATGRPQLCFLRELLSVSSTESVA